MGFWTALLGDWIIVGEVLVPQIGAFHFTFWVAHQWFGQNEVWRNTCRAFYRQERHLRYVPGSEMSMSRRCKVEMMVNSVYFILLKKGKTWGRFPFWLIFFKGVETTNYKQVFSIIFAVRVCLICSFCSKKTSWGPKTGNISLDASFSLSSSDSNMKFKLEIREAYTWNIIMVIFGMLGVGATATANHQQCFFCFSKEFLERVRLIYIYI